MRAKQGDVEIEVACLASRQAYKSDPSNSCAASKQLDQGILDVV